MSEIVEIFSLLPKDCPYFTVDIAEPEVDLVNPSAGLETYILRSSGGKNALVTYDNFIVLSAGIMLPWQFMPGSYGATAQQPDLSIALGTLQSISAIPTFLTQFGNKGFQVPILNWEIPVGAYVDAYSLGYTGTGFMIYAKIFGLSADSTPGDPKVSMGGVPSILDGETMRLKVWVKIMHNVPAIAMSDAIANFTPVVFDVSDFVSDLNFESTSFGATSWLWDFGSDDIEDSTDEDPTVEMNETDWGIDDPPEGWTWEANPGEPYPSYWVGHESATGVFYGSVTLSINSGASQIAKTVYVFYTAP